MNVSTNKHSQVFGALAQCQQRTLKSLVSVENDHTHQQQETPEANLSWNLFKAIVSGGVLFFVAKKQILTAECQSTFSLSTNQHLIVDKLKNLKVTLYQYQTCPFCSKARSFFLANRIPFKVEEVHPITKKEIKFSTYKKVPIAVVELENGDQLQVNDSSVIISAFATYMANDEATDFKQVLSQYQQTAEQKKENDDGDKQPDIVQRHQVIVGNRAMTEDEAQTLDDERKWRAWADDHLVHIISPNVYRTFDESYKSFQHHVKFGNYSNGFERGLALYGGTASMWLVSKMLTKKYCKNKDVRVDLYKACDEWIAEGVGQNLYQGGQSPNLADITVFGVLSVMEELCVWEDLMKHTAIADWYYRTKKFVLSQQEQPEQAATEQIVQTVHA